MKSAIRVLLLGLLIFALFSSWNLSAAQTSNSGSEARIISAFQAISAAESSGGNVSQLANLLNRAAALNDNANSIAQSNPQEAQSLYSQASALASQVISQAPAVGQQGAIVQRNAEIVYAAEISTLVAIAILAFLFLPRIFWNLWLRNHRRWKAKRAITDMQVLALLLIVLLVLGLGFTYSYFSQNSVSQPFSEIAVLGPNQTLGDYPKTVTAGQNFTLYLHVGDYEGNVMYYEILAKVGNISSVVNQTVSLNTPPIATYSFILSNNEIGLRQITLSLNTPFTNLKLIFELWVYSLPQQNFVYYGQWNQLLLNVTSP